MPAVTLNPDVVLVVFLPPLVYSAAFFSNLGDMRANLRALTPSSVGLVLVTVIVVAVVAHGVVDGLSWGAAFALGAIVSRTDPMAAATIMRRLQLARNAVGGVAIGLAVGRVIVAIRARTQDAQISITISLLSGYAAFVPVNAIGASGVLAAVTTGIYMGVRGPRIIDACTRLRRARRRGLDPRRQHRPHAPGLRVSPAPVCGRAGKIEDDGYEDRSLAYQQLVQAVLGAQREALVQLHNDGEISNEVMTRVVRDLDLEESRLEI